MLHNIIDQVCERPMSKSTHLSGFGDDDDDDEGPKYKELFCEYFKETLKVLCIWDCCTIWLKVIEVLSYLVFDPFTELTITLCIVVNVVFMAMDHYQIDYDFNGGRYDIEIFIILLWRLPHKVSGLGANKKLF
jgi:hypothetical protein